MAQGSATSADAPGRYDVVINGLGYMLLQTLEPSLPFRTHRAIYGYTDTFLERSNVSNAYGDNAQDFFLTGSQHDWSLGETQKFFKGTDVTSVERYYLGSNIDITVPGQATLRTATTTVSLGGSVSNAVALRDGSTFTASATNLYEISSTGVVTDRGAHGAGGLADAICLDGAYLYLSGGACSSVRRYNTTTHAFASFSSSNAHAITFLNNSLWGTGGSTNGVFYYNTVGVPTSVFQWKDAIGETLSGIPKRIVPFGGKIACLVPSLQTVSGAELWVGDTTGMQRIYELPPTFGEFSLLQSNGFLFIGGYETHAVYGCRTVIYYLANGTPGRLWSSPNWNVNFASSTVGLAEYENGLIFNDIANGVIRYYDLPTGASSAIAPYTVSANNFFLASNNKNAILTQGTANTIFFPTGAATAASGNIQTSLMDFENTLTKIFRGVKVDWTSFASDSGATVDLAYQLDSVDGSYTSLVNSAATGTEYLLPTGTSGHSISIKVTLNKGSSTNGPILKRIYVRAAPQLQTYRNRTYVLDLSGIGFKDPVRAADGSPIPLSGHEMAANLNTAILAGAISISDRFCNLTTCQTGSTTTDFFTGICEAAQCEIYDVAEGWDDPKNPGAYIAKITVREI